MIVRRLGPTGVALALVAVADAVVWSWRGDLPDPVASHWGASSVPDGFQPLGGFMLTATVMAMVLCAVFGAIGWFWGRSAVTRRIAAGATVWAGGFGAGQLLLVLGAQRGLRDAASATLPGWTMPLVVVLPLAPAVIAGFLVRGDRADPATNPVPADARRIPLTGDERAVWIKRAGGGPGLIVGTVTTAGVVIVAVVLRQWGMLVVPLLLVTVFAVMFSYRVRVDATGLTVRSSAGWPGTHIPADEVERASVVEVRPLREFGGWGWRVGRGGRVGVVLRAGDGLLVERTGGRTFVVTVDDAAEGAALLNTLADRARR